METTMYEFETKGFGAAVVIVLAIAMALAITISSQSSRDAGTGLASSNVARPVITAIAPGGSARLWAQRALDI
jgi:hypothetical protein